MIKWNRFPEITPVEDKTVIVLESRYALEDHFGFHMRKWNKQQGWYPYNDDHAPKNITAWFWANIEDLNMPSMREERENRLKKYENRKQDNPQQV